MTWKVNSRATVTCSLIKEPVVYLSRKTFTKIGLLMTEYPSQEWLGYMTGEEKENCYLVEDITIPPHSEVSSASAEAEPFNQPDRCLGVIHSHNSMGAFHSGTDEAYVDHNYQLSITVAKRGGTIEFDTICNVKTECKKWVSVKGHITVEPLQIEPDMERFLKEAKENIDKGKRYYIHGQGVVLRSSVNKEETIQLPSPVILGANYRFYGDEDLDPDDELLAGKDGRRMGKKSVTELVHGIFNRKDK